MCRGSVWGGGRRPHSVCVLYHDALCVWCVVCECVSVCVCVCVCVLRRRTKRERVTDSDTQRHACALYVQGRYVCVGATVAQCVCVSECMRCVCGVWCVSV